MDRILDWLIPSSRLRHRDFWALRQVSFSIPKGVSIGIIGANGAGKSTLLKIISGTTKPTSGNVSVEGKVAALLELGMGFHTEFTGRQNIRMNGRLLGLGEEELEAKIPQIIAFSELGDFIDQPLRTYSSGMFVRLGFSVVASVEPDILIIDEALSVGDTHFQQKCVRRIREFHEQGATLLFVSHDPGAVKTLCQEAILLDEGEIISRGAPDDILDHYNALIARKSVKGAGFHIARVETPRKNIITRHSGNFMALITDAAILNEKGERISAAVAGETVKIYVRVIFVTETENPTIGLLIKDRLG
ncbi:MAG: ABC transporter ATP-binding protein, partial [Candidatus Sumerlaeota bacterium]|nr:ABC transporter ATP-binding protein [Candidatus Sumerlaeota bacterium]